VGAAIGSDLSVDASLVSATYGAILKSGPAPRRRQILKRPSRLWHIDVPWVGGARRAHDFRFGNTRVLHRPTWGFIFRRKPWFGQFPFGHLPFGPFFRNHNGVVIA